MYIPEGDFLRDTKDIMELCNGNCGLICDDTDDEEDVSPSNSPIPPRRIIPSPPLPPRRPSPSPTPSPTPNNHLRNGRHLMVPKENAPPPPSSVTVILSSTNDHLHNNKVNTEAKYDMLHRASSPSPIPPVPPGPPTVARAHIRRSHTNQTTANIVQTPPILPEKMNRATSTGFMVGPPMMANIVPPVPPPLSAPRPPKGSKENSRQDHHYENTIVIPGTRQHVVKNINLEANRARLTALMRGRDDACGPASKVESAAYENVNVEHISRLTALGFPQDAVIRALGITRNDLEMACDILHEFATKSS